MSRKVTAMFLSVFLVLSAFVVPASAAEFKGGTASPAYEVGVNPTSELAVSGTIARCSCAISGRNCVKITAEQTLEKYWGLWIWTSVDGARWAKTVNSSTISMSNTKSGLSSGKYRLKTVFTLTDSSGKTETITVYSSEKTVS